MAGRRRALEGNTTGVDRRGRGVSGVIGQQGFGRTTPSAAATTPHAGRGDHRVHRCDILYAAEILVARVSA